jgi:hypothetical protein
VEVNYQKQAGLSMSKSGVYAAAVGYQAWSVAVTDNAPFSNNAPPPQNSPAIRRRRIAFLDKKNRSGQYKKRRHEAAFWKIPQEIPSEMNSPY